MKPPPRTRRTPRLKSEPAPTPAPQSTRWDRTEQMKLLNALKKLDKTSENEDIDYTVLEKSVRTRSASEIQSVVESLKNKVISHVSFKYKKRKYEQKVARKPIQVWTDMASSLAGTLEESITTAFSQMLIVSSTEPRTLRNCDPPEIHRLPPGERPAGRTVPLRPMARFPDKGQGPGTNTARPHQVFKTPARPSKGPAVKVTNGKICPPQQQLSTTAGTSPALTSTSQSPASSCQLVAAKILAVPSVSPQTVSPVAGQTLPTSSPVAGVKTVSLIQNTQQPSEQHPPPTITTTSTTTQSTSSSPNTPLSISVTPVPRTAPSSVASSSSATSSHSTPTPAAPTSHARFGCTSKSVTKNPPRMLGVKYVVDFEKIYRYLSAIHKPNDECCLTPMESAIVLDLLMSLPEELPLLDCKKLHKHLIQVYQCLSSPADSKMAQEMFKKLKGGLDAQTEAASSRDSQLDAAGTADSAEVTDGGGKRLQPDEAEGQSSSDNNTSSKSDDTDVMGHCPPLNPFMVPLNLLVRR